MITVIRKSFKSRAYKIFLWVTLLAVAGVFSVVEMIKNIFTGKAGGSSWVLQVNNTTILMPEFARSVADQQERIRIMRAQYGQYADMYFQMMGLSLDPQRLALDSLVRKSLLNQIAAKMPLHVASDVAQSQLNNPMLISQELSDLVPFATWDPSLGGINRNLLHGYLRQMGISKPEFDEQLAQGIKRNDVRLLVEHAAYTPEFQTKQHFSNLFLGHKFSIATINSQDVLAQVKKEAISDEKLKAYYDLKNAQEKRYSVPEKRSAKIVTFEPNSYGITVSDEEADKYYQNNKAQFVDQATQVQVRRILLKVDDASKDKAVAAQAEKIRQELLQKPEQFAAKAKELSQDSKTASQGGLLPAFTKGTHDATFEKTAFLLKDDGAISAVVRTKDGYEMVQRVNKKAQTFKPLSAVSKDIKEKIRQKKFTERFASDMRSLVRQNSKEAVQAFIKEKHGKENNATDVVAGATPLTKTIFSLKNNDSGYFQENNQGTLVTLTNVKATSIPALESIKDRVKEDYYKDEAAKQIKARLADIVSSGSLGNAKIEKTGWLRHSKDFNADKQELKDLASKGIDLNRIFQLENKGSIATFERNGNGYAVRLDDIAAFEPAAYQEKKGTITSELEQQKKSLATAGFVASLYRNAKIKQNESPIRTES